MIRKPSLEVAPPTLTTVSSCDLELLLTTLTFESDLDSARMNQLAKGHSKLLSRQTDALKGIR